MKVPIYDDNFIFVLLGLVWLPHTAVLEDALTGRKMRLQAIWGRAFFVCIKCYGREHEIEFKGASWTNCSLNRVPKQQQR